MKNHYQTLNVSRNANLHEIKRAYRKLAKLYHPDTSTYPDAHSRFAEINQAYSVLSDPQQKTAYDSSILYGGTPNDKRPRARAQAQSPADSTREMRKKLERIRKQQIALRKAYYKQYLHKSQVVLVVVLVFVLAIFTDYVSKPHRVTEVILDRDSKIRTASCNFPLQHKMFRYGLRIGAEVVIDVTPLFRQSKRIYFTDGKRNLALPPEYGVYGSYAFFPVLMLFGCVWALLLKKEYFFVYSMAVVVSLTSAILIFLMIVSN